MEIQATRSRMEVLDEFGIKYKVDTDFNFVFSCPKDADRAVVILTNALEI